ncbi:hypothetical protein B0H12DRAFT_544847 [Mycena haematopus]|nr:hypothetical protein B0H12DRAFT_544847 [Mycena haematopus]
MQHVRTDSRTSDSKSKARKRERDCLTEDLIRVGVIARVGRRAGRRRTLRSNSRHVQRVWCERANSVQSVCHGHGVVAFSLTLTPTALKRASAVTLHCRDSDAASICSFLVPFQPHLSLHPGIQNCILLDLRVHARSEWRYPQIKPVQAQGGACGSVRALCERSCCDCGRNAGVSRNLDFIGSAELEASPTVHSAA